MVMMPTTHRHLDPGIGIVGISGISCMTSSIPHATTRQYDHSIQCQPLPKILACPTKSHTQLNPLQSWATTNPKSSATSRQHRSCTTSRRSNMACSAAPTCWTFTTRTSQRSVRSHTSSQDSSSRSSYSSLPGCGNFGISRAMRRRRG